MDNKKTEEAKIVAEESLALFRKHKKKFPEFYNLNLDMPDYLFRYSTTGVLLKNIRFLVEILEKLKEFEGANDILKKLLKMDICPYRRGKWWIRLIINFG